MLTIGIRPGLTADGGGSKTDQGVDLRQIGGFLVIGGAIAIVIGALLFTGWLSWFGRLPGDIRIVSENTRFYFPITSMILVSVVATIVVNVIRRFL
jgi:NAD/NADP transhydrogenase beta subunit